jgi:multiple sugar transport system substrate-binding protein
MEKTMKFHRLLPLTLTFLLIAGLALSACTSAPSQEAATEPEAAPAASGEQVTLRYALWDANQLPPYEACAEKFMELNPNIAIKIEQSGWDDYWPDLQTGFVAGTAPDVFTNNISKLPEFVSKGQVIDIQPWVERDGVFVDQFIGDLADLWAKESARYGFPKDWDTVAVFYNKAMLEEAGIDPAVMEDWTWNPQDGGTFEEVVAKLTLDANGNNGLSPDFDPDNIVQYGFITENSTADGHTQWSHWAVSNGWYYNDGPWSSHYYYDDPAFAEAIQWYADLHLEKGYSPPFEDTSSLGKSALFAAGKGAMTTDGSWMINWYAENTDFEIGFGKLPIGPEGRKSMFNGISDTIWVGTEHPDEAWEWVKYLASSDCLDSVGASAVVFPSIQSGVDAALAAFEAKGLDVSAFTEEALDPEGTFLYPVTDHASEIVAIMTPVLDAIMLGQTTAAEALPEANAKINALFE